MKDKLERPVPGQPQPPPDALLLGESEPIEELKRLIARVTHSNTNILIIGESGTGKELVARTIHETGPLKNSPFIAVNCGAIPENLIESEMFGHQKGSFTGAVSDKMGLFEAANQGTLFLDEVGELPLALQVKLLRSIQEKKIRRVGGLEDILVDVRIIAATNRDLERAVVQGSFREDLYYRLNVILIKTPPLRERVSDIEILAKIFLTKFAQRNKKEMKGFTQEALKCLKTYSWPGNVRELENAVERAVTLESDTKIGLASLPAACQENFKLLSEHHKSRPAVGLETPLVGAKREKGSSDLPPPKKASGISLVKPDFRKGKVHLSRIVESVQKFYADAAIEACGGVNRKAADLLDISLEELRRYVSFHK